MINDYISLSTLNDFVFCPYSIYLHNVYMNTDEGLYHAVPQTRGKAAHAPTDNQTGSSHKEDLLSLSVYSDELGISGQIDYYRGKDKFLVERKYQLKQIYQGQLYQLWGEYFCMIEMGYQIEKLAFYEISTRRMIPMKTPLEREKRELADFIERFRHYDPSSTISVNKNKCLHCIYINLCDKINLENVYT